MYFVFAHSLGWLFYWGICLFFFHFYIVHLLLELYLIYTYVVIQIMYLLQAFSCRTLESAFNLGRLFFFCLHSTSCNSWLESVALGGHLNILSFSKQLDITLLRVVWNFQSTIIIQTTIGPSVLMKLAHQTEYQTIFEVWDPTNICVEIVWWKF